jgi:hypothetical protein
MGQGGRSCNSSWEKTPFSYIEAGRGRDFVRARASYDPVTGEPVFKSIKLVDVHDKLMVSFKPYFL